MDLDAVSGLVALLHTHNKLSLYSYHIKGPAMYEGIWLDVQYPFKH